MKKLRLLTTLFLFLSPFTLIAFDAGAPVIPASGETEIYTGFTLNYDESFEQAAWVAYTLTDIELKGQIPRTNDFHSDPNISTGSASLEDYLNSGFDRGHLAPAADMKWSLEAMNNSFLLSNVSPQLPAFNRGIWKSLEEQVRTWAIQNHTLSIITGPVLTDPPYDTIGKNHVAVPKRYYKVIFDFTLPERKAIGFIIPNKAIDAPLFTFAVPVDEVERITGLDFFPNLRDRIEESLEALKDLDHWGLSEISGEINNMTDTSLDNSKIQLKSKPEIPIYWINSASNIRHNSSCRYFGRTKSGYYTTEKREKACSLCNG